MVTKIFAGVLSLLCVGLGQLYTGALTRAMVLQIINITLLFSLALFSSYKTFLFLFLILFIGVYLFNIVDAVRSAKKGRTVSAWNRWYVCVVWILVFGFLTNLASSVVRQHRVEMFKIASGSMIPTLEVGDHITVTKNAYVSEAPKRNDVVLYQLQDDPNTQDKDESLNRLVGRIVGSPGDLVEVRGANLYINNEEQNELHAKWLDGGIAEGNFGPTVVPDNHYFLLGDNRDRSRDLRFRSQNFLPRDDILGKVGFIYFPSTWDRLGLDVNQ